MNMKTLLLTIGLIAVLGIGYWFIFINNDDTPNVTYNEEAFTFVSDDDREFSVRFSEDGGYARLNLNDQEYDLQVATSGSGAKYANKDESVIYWEHQGTAMVEINGNEIFSGATLKSNEADKREEASTNPLFNTSWQWKETLYNNDDVVKPNIPDSFVLTFAEEDRFSATTDCNNMFGNYEIVNSQIKFGQIASTKMACPDIESQEIVFAEMLEAADGYLITAEGDLALTLKLDTGSMIFTPVTE